MQFNKPKFWQHKNIISYLLFPISLLVQLFIFLKKKITKPIKFNIPIICVGNIYIGGTGKTPTSIYLAKELFKFGKNPTIFRKYYKSHFDEHLLIKKNFSNLILNNDRVKGVSEAKAKNYDTIIFDDGFQDYKIVKDLNIVCFNQNQLIGNGFVIPAGPLRENITSLKNANLVLINGTKNSNFEKKILEINKNLKIFYCEYKPSNLSEFEDKKLLALAGIGNPDNFFKLLADNNLDVRKKMTFPDHYKFNKDQIKNISEIAKKNNYHIVMTEKDYYKIEKFQLDNIKYLKVEIKIFNKESFFKIIKEIYDKKN
jgi:tetraacyldisaccharide 4'-kinase